MRVVVFGANGAVGRSLVAKLCDEGHHEVWAIVKNQHQLMQFGDKFAELMGSPELKVLVADVFIPEQIAVLGPQTGMADSVVYLIGHCPPGGMAKEVGTPPTDLSLSEISYDWQRHVAGMFNVFCSFLPWMKEGGSFIVLGSAINGLWGLLPKNLFAGSYASAKAAQHVLARALRNDPEVTIRRLRVQYLRAGAINTEFHQGAPKELLPPAMVPLEKVTGAIVEAMFPIGVVDKLVVPFKQRIGNVVAGIIRRVKWGGW